MDTRSAWLAPKELATELKVSMTTVWRWLREGAIPALKIGRHYRIPADAAQKLMTQQKSA